MGIQNFSACVETYFRQKYEVINCDIFQHEKVNFVSPSGHLMFYLLNKHL